jgi:hypothetical protein
VFVFRRPHARTAPRERRYSSCEQLTCPRAPAGLFRPLALRFLGMVTVWSWKDAEGGRREEAISAAQNTRAPGFCLWGSATTPTIHMRVPMRSRAAREISVRVTSPGVHTRANVRTCCCDSREEEKGRCSAKFQPSQSLRSQRSLYFL